MYIKSVYGEKSIDYVILLNAITIVYKSKPYTIDKLAERANVSLSTVSRFITKYGFKNYKAFCHYLTANITSIKKEKFWLYEVTDNSYDKSTVDKLYELIMESIEIIIIGYPIPQSLYFLQPILESTNKRIKISSSMRDQAEILKYSNASTTLIVLDYGYNDHVLSQMFADISYRNIILFSGNVRDNLKGELFKLPKNSLDESLIYLNNLFQDCVRKLKISKLSELG